MAKKTQFDMFLEGITGQPSRAQNALPEESKQKIEEYNKGTVTDTGDPITDETIQYASGVLDQTDEAKNLRASWFTPPSVRIENGKIKLSGTSEFLKSNEAQQLRDTFNEMKGKTYNNEDLQKQVEAWNAALEKMAGQYMDTVQAMNLANSSIAQSAKNPDPHMLTFQDMQKIATSAAIGKKPDARTSKDKIFVGYEWDEQGNMVERWVEAKEFFNEFNATDNEDKRTAYRDLITRSNEGDVGAYSKLMYLQGGASGKPVNVDYEAVEDFLHTTWNNMLVPLAQAADFITNYVPFFNTYRLTGRVRRAAEQQDINEFFKSDEVSKAIEDYSEVVTWENAYFSELTPGSTQLAAQIGSTTGQVLGMAYSIWGGGVGNQAATAMVSQAISRANNALYMTGKFTEFSETTVSAGRKASNTTNALSTKVGSHNWWSADGAPYTADVFSAGAKARVLLPTALVQKFPRFAMALASGALDVMKATGVGEGIYGTVGKNIFGRPTINIQSGVGTMADVYSAGDSITTATERTVTSPSIPTVNNLSKVSGRFGARFGFGTGGLDTSKLSGLAPKYMNVNVYDNGVSVSKITLDAFSGNTLLTKQMLANGLQMGMRLAPLAGESAIRNVDQYLRGVADGKDMGDMADYVLSNTARDLVVGGAFLGAGAAIRKIKGVSRAAKVSPTRTAKEAFETNTQNTWYKSSTVTEEPTKYLEAFYGEDKELQNFVASIVTANGESLFISPNVTLVATNYEGVPIDFVAGEEIVPDGTVVAKPTSYEFAPIPNSNAMSTSKAFGAASATKFTKLEVEPVAGGANLVRTETDALTGTTTTTKKFYVDIDEATAAARAEAVPKTTSKTIANSDALEGAKVAPFTIDGKAPDVLPDGVSQVKVQPGVVYRTPDGLVDEVANIAREAGKDDAGIYKTYEDFVEIYKAKSISDAEDKIGEAPSLPSADGSLLDKIKFMKFEASLTHLVRVAAWAKVRGYNLIPLKTPETTPYVKTGARNQKIILGKEPSETTKSIIAYDKRIKSANSAINNLEEQISYTDNGRIIENAKNRILEKTALDGISPDYQRPEIDTTSSKQFLEELGIGSVSPITGRKLYVDKDSYIKFNNLDTTFHKNEHIPSAIKDFIVGKNEGVRRGIKSSDIKTLPQLEKYLSKATGKNISADDINDAINSYSASEAIESVPDVDIKTIMSSPGVNIDELPFDLTNDGNMSVLDILDKTPGKAAGGTLRDYYRKEKGLETTVVLMPPNRYNAILSQYNTPNETLESIKEDKSTSKYTLDMKAGDKFPTPVLRFDKRGFDGQEGRHRAIAAANNGFEYIPVGIRHPVGENVEKYIGDDDFYDITEEVSDIVTALSGVNNLKSWQDIMSQMVEQRQKYIDKQISESQVPSTGAARKTALAPNIYYNQFPEKHLTESQLDKQLDKIPAKIKLEWYAEGRRGARDEISDIILTDPELRNAALSKMYDEWRKTMRTVGGKYDISYEDWLDTDITLYRWENSNENNDSYKVLSYSFEPGGYQQFGNTPTVITVKPRETVGMADYFAESEQEVFVPIEIIRSRAEIDKELKERQRAAIMSTGNEAPDIEDIKTFAEVMDRDTLLHGIGMGDLKRGDLLKALITNKITVYSNTPISDGAIVSPIKIGNYSKEVNLSDVAWTSPTRGIVASDTVYPTLFDYATFIGNQNGGEIVRVKVEDSDQVVDIPNKFLVTFYGMPEAWFPTKEEAMAYAKRMGERAVYELDEDADTLERPPVTTDTLALLNAGQPLLKLSASGYPTEALRQFNGLMLSLPTLESPEDYTRGIVDIVHAVQAIYNQVAMNIDLASLYENYGRAIAEGKEPTALGYEMESLRPLLQVLDALGHYFDPSGKSLTQGFYLPTAPKPKKKINIEDALLGKDGVVDEDDPVDGGLDDILLDPTRIGDSGFWQKRTGDLFRDAEGNFTMDKSGSLEEALIAYTVSALTRGKNKLMVAAQNEVARSKFDNNRRQITSKQALAGLKDADTIRAKAKAIQANISKDAEALAEIKENYSGDESTIDKALEEKNYADELNYTVSLNTTAQKLGYNQFLQMSPIKGSAVRFGGNATNFRGITNIRRKLEKINVTGTAWVERFGEKVNVGFGLDPTPANKQIYGDFKPEKAINLGTLINLNFDSDRAAVAFLQQIRTDMNNWASGDGWDLMSAISNFARTNFPLSDSEWYTAQLMKKIGQNFDKYRDPHEAFLANATEISKWIRRGTLDTFNNAIKMTNLSNLDNRTIKALDEAAAWMLIGSPVKRAKTITYAQEIAVWSALGLNPRVAIGNVLQEPLRLIDIVGYKGFVKAWKTALNTKEAIRINAILADLPSRFTEPEMVGLAQKAKTTFGKLKDKAEKVGLSWLEKSEQFKNVLFWAAAEDNARVKFPNDPQKQLQETLRFFNDYAIAGGKGTVPGVATGSLGRTLNIFKTFTIRNFDDFIDYIQKVARGESGNNYWDEKYKKRHSGSKNGGKEYKDKTGRNKFDPRIAARVVGGRVLRSYLFWLLVGSYFGKDIMDALGGDPTGITDGGYDRGIYDDPDTEEYEGMTGLDNFVNSLPAGFILGLLQDAYFAARRRGIDQHQFMAFDIMNDKKFNQSLESKLPLGIAKNRFADMLDLVDRGYSFSSTGRKTYAAPETALDTVKGFLFGKSTTANSLAYGKYRYGMVDIWGDLSSGDWLDFAMNANPINNIIGTNATFDTTRKDYTGVFNGSWNDISTMQLIIQQFRERQQKIIDDFQENKYRYRGDYEGLTDEQKLAKAKEQREKDIEEYTNDVVRAVDAFTKAGNSLSDSQITNIMYLFDFHEGEEDDEWNSSYARERYVEAGLPDYDTVTLQRGKETVGGEEKEVTKNYLDRSLILKNAEQGFYGSSKRAANEVKEALKDFKSVYKDYSSRIKTLNDRYYSYKNKKSAEAKKIASDVEKLQNEYLDKLYDKLTPVVEKYGTALIGTYDVADVLQDYMGNMIPYSSIKKYGQTYSSGNDIVYGQLTEWLQKRWGRSAPTAPSDSEVTSGISEIRKLLDDGKTASAKSKARAILEKIGRGSLGARREDVETLRRFAYD